MAKEKTNSKEVLNWLKVGGILCAIAGGSAIILTSLNLVTAPIIEKNNSKKAGAGYLTIFSSYDHKSDKTAIEENTYLDSYEIVYDSANNELGYVYTSKVTDVHGYGDIQAMVGISGSNDSPILGKVYLIKDTISYKNVFEPKYVEPYNADPSDTTLNNVKCGATYASTTLQSMINAARDHYSTLGDGFVENLEEDIKTIWGEDAGYNISYSTSSAYSGSSDTIKKTYTFLEDETMTGEIGRLYACKFKDAGGNLYITVGFNSNNYGKLAITNNTIEDEATKKTVEDFVTKYNENPSEETLNTASGTYAEAIKAMVTDSYNDFKANGLQSCANAFPTIVSSSAYKAVSEPTVLEASTDNEKVLRYWSLYSDEEKTTEVGKIYKINVDMAEKENASKGIYADIESHTTFLLAISGEKDEPLLGKLATLRSTGGAGQIKTINDYLDNFNGEEPGSKTGATYTLKAVWRGIQKAVELYKK